jgi:hypothetical protein
MARSRPCPKSRASHRTGSPYTLFITGPGQSEQEFVKKSSGPGVDIGHPGMRGPDGGMFENRSEPGGPAPGRGEPSRGRPSRRHPRRPRRPHRHWEIPGFQPGRPPGFFSRDCSVCPPGGIDLVFGDRSGPRRQIGFRFLPGHGRRPWDRWSSIRPVVAIDEDDRRLWDSEFWVFVKKPGCRSGGTPVSVFSGGV